MRNKATLLAALAALIALPAFAQPGLPSEPGYTYVGLGYANSTDDSGDADVDFDIVGLDGSFEIGDRFHLWASVDRGKADEDFVELTATTMAVGVGVQATVANGLSAYARLGAARIDLEASFDFGVLLSELVADTDGDLTVSASDDANGAVGSVGLRGFVIPELELGAGVTVIKASDLDTETSLDLGAEFRATEMLGVRASVSFGDDVRTYGLGVRLNF